MQDEINEKTIALYIKTGKLTAQTLQKAMKTLLAQMKKQKDKTPQGKQTLKQLMKQNAGVSNIEITEGNIKAFESTAKKYGIDFALKKDTTENPPRKLSRAEPAPRRSAYRHCGGGHYPACRLHERQEREEVPKRHGIRFCTLGRRGGYKAVYRPCI